jgi:hypothetical protein
MTKWVVSFVLTSVFISIAIAISVWSVKQIGSGLVPDFTMQQAIALTFLSYVLRGFSYMDFMTLKKAKPKFLIEAYLMNFFSVPLFYAALSMILFAIF